jgi:hypothetical protein
MLITLPQTRSAPVVPAPVVPASSPTKNGERLQSAEDAIVLFEQVIYSNADASETIKDRTMVTMICFDLKGDRSIASDGMSRVFVDTSSAYIILKNDLVRPYSKLDEFSG